MATFSRLVIWHKLNKKSQTPPICPHFCQVKLVCLHVILSLGLVVPIQTSTPSLYVNLEARRLKTYHDNGCSVWPAWLLPIQSRRPSKKECTALLVICLSPSPRYTLFRRRVFPRPLHSSRVNMSASSATAGSQANVTARLRKHPQCVWPMARQPSHKSLEIWSACHLLPTLWISSSPPSEGPIHVQSSVVPVRFTSISACLTDQRASFKSPPSDWRKKEEKGRR